MKKMLKPNTKIAGLIKGRRYMFEFTDAISVGQCADVVLARIFLVQLDTAHNKDIPFDELMAITNSVMEMVGKLYDHQQKDTSTSTEGEG